MFVFSLSAYAGSPITQKILADKVMAATVKTDKCQSADLEYITQLGGGDEASVVYNNVYARFIKGETEQSSYWFYVYEKGAINLLNDMPKDHYSSFPQYLVVRVYDGDREREILNKYSDTIHRSKLHIYVVNKQKFYNPFYFEAENQEHAVNVLLAEEKTTILSAQFDGEDLAHFSAKRTQNVLRKVACGETKPVFYEMLKSVTIL